MPNESELPTVIGGEHFIRQIQTLNRQYEEARTRQAEAMRAAQSPPRGGVRDAFDNDVAAMLTRDALEDIRREEDMAFIQQYLGRPMRDASTRVDLDEMQRRVDELVNRSAARESGAVVDAGSSYVRALIAEATGQAPPPEHEPSPVARLSDYEEVERRMEV